MDLTTSTQFDCRSYLAVELPDQLRKGARTDAQPIIVIQVLVVDQPSCRFAYRIGPSEVHVSPGVNDEAHLTLAFTSRDLEAFSRGSLDAQDAIRSTRLKVMGDERLLLWLSDRIAA